MGSRAEPANEPSFRRSYLIDQGIPLVTLSDSAFRAGQFSLFVYAMDRMMQVQRAFGRSPEMKAKYDEQSARYRKALTDAAAPLELLADAFGRGRGLATMAGIGASVEPTPGTQMYRIAELVPGMPAGDAGIKVGDLLTAIDGVPTTGLAAEEVIRCLRGAAQATVTLTLLRDGQRQEVRLQRAPLYRLSSDRRADLTAALTGLRDLSAQNAKELRVEASRVIKDGDNSEPAAAFDDLQQSIRHFQAILRRARLDGLALVGRGLAGEPIVDDLFHRTLAAIAQADKATILALDRESEDLLKNNPGLSDLYKGLLDMAEIFVSTLDGADQKITRLSEAAADARAFAERAPAPGKTAQTLNAIEGRLNQWRAVLVTDAAKIEAMESSLPVYEDYVTMLADLGLAEESLLASEHAHERTLADLLKSHGDSAEPQLSFPSPQAGQQPLLSMETATPSTLEQIGGLVRDTGSTVLEYFQSNNEILIWVVQAPSQAVSVAPGVTVHLRRKRVMAEEVRKIASALRNAIENASHQEVSDNSATVSVPLRDLYNILIAPVADLLPKEADRPVIIVPHGILSFVPFAALARPSSDDPSRSDRYLIEDHALQYAPSLGVLRIVREAHRGTPLQSQPSLLAVVNPAFGTEPGGPSFKPLPYLEANVGQVTKFYDAAHTRLLKGKDAFPDAVVAAARSRDVILFLTHAVALEKTPYDFICRPGEQKPAGS